MDRLKELRRNKGLSLKALGQHLGVAESTIHHYENGNRQPDYNMLLRIADFFNVSVDYLLGKDEPFDIFSIPNITPLPEMERKPIVGRVACGVPITAIENIEGYAEVPFGSKIDFCLIASGDSMINARIFNGDIVYIHQQPDVENGEIAVVLIDDEATLKRVYKSEGKITLRAENPIYKDIVYTENELKDIKILGKAVQFLSKVL